MPDQIPTQPQPIRRSRKSPEKEIVALFEVYSDGTSLVIGRVASVIEAASKLPRDGQAV